MFNQVKRTHRWVASALLAMAASASMADTPVSLQRLTPTIWASGPDVFSLQDESNFTTLTLQNVSSTALYGEATHPYDGAYYDPSFDRRFVTPNTYSIVDKASTAVYEIGSTGGVTLTAGVVAGQPGQPALTPSGTLTITDLAVNFGTKIISATLIGSNGLGTVQNVPLWTVDNISSSVLACPDNGGMCDAGGPGLVLQPEHRLMTTSTGLHLTAQGGQAFQQALGYQPDILPYFDFGTLKTSTMYLSGSDLHVVPEPGTWMLMSTGLIGLLAAARRQPHQR